MQLVRIFFWSGMGSNGPKMPVLVQKIFGRLWAKNSNFFAHKRPNLAQNWLFWPDIGICGPFGLMADQNTMQRRCLGGFSVTWVPKLLLPPVRLGFMAPKGQIWSKISIFGQLLAFLAYFFPCPTKKNANKSPRCFFIRGGFFRHFESGLAGSCGALLVGWLVVVARGLYLARHLSTL